MRAFGIFFMVASMGAFAGCKPSPESFRLISRSGQSISFGAGTTSTTMSEGDVLVLDASPLDADFDEMDLCVTATVTTTSVLDVWRVQGKCRRFIIAAKASGAATVGFSARDGSESLAVTVTPIAPP